MNCLGTWCCTEKKLRWRSGTCCALKTYGVIALVVVSCSRRWFRDMLDIEKHWSYWPHGGYLLLAGRQSHCLSPCSNIHFIAAFGGLKTAFEGNVRDLKTLLRMMLKHLLPWPKTIGTLALFPNNSQFSWTISWNWWKYFISTILYFTVNITEPLFLIQNLIYPFKSENKNKWHWQNYWHPRLNIWYHSLWTK